jgi:hypothetical protein
MSNRNREQPDAKQEEQQPVCEVLAGQFSFQIFEAPTKDQSESKAYQVGVRYRGEVAFEPCSVDELATCTYIQDRFPVAIVRRPGQRELYLSFQAADDFAQAATETCFLVGALRNGRTVQEWWEAGGKNQQVVVRKGNQEFVPEPDQSPEVD